MMIFINEVYKINKLPKAYAEGFVKMISCIAPHIGEEMWEKLGHDNTIAYENWPQYDEAKTIDNTIEIAVQVNGKVRARFNAPVNADKDELIKLAEELPEVKKFIDGKTIVKQIAVPNKLVNIVVK